MLALLARVLSGNSGVYEEIQSHNPYALAMRHRLQMGLETCAQRADAGEFAGWLAQIAAALQPLLPTLNAHSSVMLEALRPASQALEPAGLENDHLPDLTRELR
jgi:hypothetical protein